MATTTAETGIISIKSVPQVTDASTAEQFIRWCVLMIGGGFHPDTSFDDYINLKSRKRLFSDKACEALERHMAVAVKFIDVYEAGMDAVKSIAEKDKESICGICSKKHVGYGNNSTPVTNVRCCDGCNNSFVIPARLKALKAFKIGK